MMKSDVLNAAAACSVSNFSPSGTPMVSMPYSWAAARTWKPRNPWAPVIATVVMKLSVPLASDLLVPVPSRLPVRSATDLQSRQLTCVLRCGSRSLRKNAGSDRPVRSTVHNSVRGYPRGSGNTGRGLRLVRALLYLPVPQRLFRHDEYR